MRPFVYATRSVIPSRFANSVQSANMACAFSDVFEDFSTVFRRSKGPDAELSSVFAPYGLRPPRNAHAIVERPALDWSYSYLAAFHSYFLRCRPESVVYTRCGRVSWAAMSAGLTTIIELHNPLSSAYAAWLRQLRRSRRLTKLVATTDQLKRDVVDRVGFHPDQVHVAGGGANLSFLDLPPLPLIKRFEFNVGYAGSALKGKGLEVLMACAAQLPTVGFHVIGPSVQECCRFGAVGANVVVYGRQENPRVMGLLKSMDCLLLANQRSVILNCGTDIGNHTSPLKMFEYMAAGRAILASNLPVLNGTLKDGHNALLCDPEDVEGFCRLICRLRDQPNLRAQLGAMAQEGFRASYSWCARARRLRDFICG